MQVANSSKQSFLPSLPGLEANRSLSGYASDISMSSPSHTQFPPSLTKRKTARTYPTSPTGRFTTAQAELYNAVLVTLKHCTALCTESSGMNLYDLHAESCRVLTRELNKLGFSLNENMTGPGSSDVEKVLYPHFLSHPVGIGMFLVLLQPFHCLLTTPIIKKRPTRSVHESQYPVRPDTLTTFSNDSNPFPDSKPGWS